MYGWRYVMLCYVMLCYSVWVALVKASTWFNTSNSEHLLLSYHVHTVRNSDN